MNNKVFLALLVSGSILAFVGSAISQPLSGSAEPSTQTPQHFRQEITRTAQLDYLLFLPEGYSANGTRKWPLMLFLHGAGERGINVEKVTVHGPPKIVKSKKDFPFVLVSPQCPEDQIWHDDELLLVLDSVVGQLNIDTNRIYLTGLSMGGYGSWSLGTKHPERFAAMAPICGGGEILPILLASGAQKRALNSLGVWAFHGAKDPVVPLEESQRIANALMRAGCKDVKLTVYPEAGHDAWTQAYNEPELWAWFLGHERGKGGSPAN
jgi:predicted peptidase